MTYNVYLAPGDLVGEEFGRDTWIDRGEDFRLAAAVVADSLEEVHRKTQNGENTLGWEPQWIGREAVVRRHIDDPRSTFVGDVISKIGRYNKREKDYAIRRKDFSRWEPRRDTPQDIRDRQEQYLSHPNLGSDPGVKL